MMDTYIDKLAPWERRNAYYKDIKLGNKKLVELKKILKNQTEEMIKAQIASANEIISSQDIREDVIKEIGYDIKSVGQGMGGLKAAFEWGISDVVWCIEKDTEELRSAMQDLYLVPDRQLDELRYNADNAFAMEDMNGALERFAELETFIKDDFSAYISIGMIFLFHKIDKEKALEYFDRAIKYKRDFGLIEEAEKCSSEAIKLSPGFSEAKYQNAQYNALLNRPDEAIPLLKKVIKDDIAYCLKINGEHDFEQINSKIAELYEEIRTEKYEKVKETLEETKKNVVVMNTVTKSIKKLGYDVPKDSEKEIFQDGTSEIDKLIKNNSIFDAHFAEILLPLLFKKLNRKKELLRRKGNEIHLNLDRQIQEISDGVVGKKKKGGPVSFLIHFLCGQIVALPFGWYIGIPLGICITEGLLFAICFYINVILPQSQWKDIQDKQNEQDKLLRVMKKL
jgi:tetratricopeptide (TPR) repeat protein